MLVLHVILWIVTTVLSAAGVVKLFIKKGESSKKALIEIAIAILLGIIAYNFESVYDFLSNLIFIEETTTSTDDQTNKSEIVDYYPDGYLKLSFYDGGFSYRNYDGQEVIYKDDIITFDRAYFNDEIESTVYITIIDDDTNQIVYDGKSEHMDSYLIGLPYGTYILIASCDSYQKYNATITLSPNNKTSDVWRHRIYFLPDTYIANDVKVQVLSKDGIPYSNIEVSIGIPGYSFTETVDENGVFNELFVLKKGEYLVYIQGAGLHGRFFVNELTNDESLIVVTLDH